VNCRLHHLALGARDVERVATFYRDVLGLNEIARHHRGDGTLRSIWLDLGGAILMIEATAEAPRRVEGVGAGPFLLALRAPASHRIELERALEAAGSAIESRTDFTSYARDPEGNRVAISSHPSVTAR
jgi:glyoxylase I family protein